VLTGAEMAKLVDATPERWQALIFTMGWLGLRWSEALGLQRRDFNPLKGQLYVGNHVVVEVDGRNVTREGGKTDSAARLLSVPPAVIRWLDWHVEHYGRRPGDFLFVTDAGQLPLRTNFTRRVFAPALQESGLDGRGITLRQLRHTGASLMLDAGLALQDVSQRMGHAQPSTTFDRYSHLLTARQEAGTAALDSAILASGGRSRWSN
jgi:integrase